MADITKCSNGECDRRQRCYRWTAKDSEWRQSYAEFEGGDKCRGFWAVYDQDDVEEA